MKALRPEAGLMFHTCMIGDFPGSSHGVLPYYAAGAIRGRGLAPERVGVPACASPTISDLVGYWIYVQPGAARKRLEG